MMPEVSALGTRMNVRSSLLIVPVLLCGLFGTVVAATGRDGDPVFQLDQKRLRPVQAADLERLVADAPNPIPGSGGRKARRAECRGGRDDELQNPWSCVVRYPSKDVVRYRVRIAADRSYRGENRDGSLVVFGCCVGGR